jgi:Putative auto-transporter adhesin, head GIN domain
MRPSRALFAVSAALALGGSTASARDRDVVRGDGKVTSQKRDLPAFDAVRLDASADVAVKVGQPQSVTVKIDGNLQDLLDTSVVKGVLVIDTRKSIRPDREATVEITMPELRRFAIEGSGDVAIEGGKGALDLAIGGSGDLRWRGESSTLDARVEGSGDMRLEGRAETLRVRVEGSGDVDASRLQAVNADAKVEGSGDVELSLSGGRLNAAVEGSGDIHWRGDTRTESIAVHGSGDISRRK